MSDKPWVDKEGVTRVPTNIKPGQPWKVCNKWYRNVCKDCGGGYNDVTREPQCACSKCGSTNGDIIQCNMP